MFAQILNISARSLRSSDTSSYWDVPVENKGFSSRIASAEFGQEKCARIKYETTNGVEHVAGAALEYVMEMIVALNRLYCPTISMEDAKRPCSHLSDRQ